jgi:O-antigen ligase
LGRVAGLVARVRPWTLPVVVTACIVAFAAGSSSVEWAKHGAHAFRWILLCGLLVVAIGETVLTPSRGRSAVGLQQFAPLPTALLALALTSSGWSFTPKVTVERSLSVGLLFAAAAAVAAATHERPYLVRRMFGGLAVGAGIVAAIGLLMLAAGSNAAAQASVSGSPWRYRGFGENPNTIALLAAVMLPIATWLAATSDAWRERAAWLGIVLMLILSTVLTQSRGGMLGAFVGIACVCLVLIDRWPRKLAVVGAVGMVFAAGTLLRQETQPEAPPFHSAVQPPPASRVPHGPSVHRSCIRQEKRPPARAIGNVPGLTSTKLPLCVPAPVVSPRLLPPREDEYGHPALSITGTTAVASGRLAAWEGALRLVRERPLLGYGFGTEDKVFVDRWFSFQGARPENSAIGMLLQLGIAGLLLLAIIGTAVAGYALRAITIGGVEATVAVVGLGVLISGAIVSFIQSYVYSAGSIAALPLWLTIFLTADVVFGRPARVMRSRDSHAHSS